MPNHPWFSSRLATWYAEMKRPLPWRSTGDPYKVWLSEVIMQQTRVAQGTAYYERFVVQYPTVGHLAEAPLDDVLKLWQGLGYYSRARNLHKAAQHIHRELSGQFPRTAKELKLLSGVGEYTAAAIASICFDEPVAVVDGNVLRVLARVFGISDPIDSTVGRKRTNGMANEVLNPNAPGDHNQAVMEFGALHCRPRNPLCHTCIFADKCVAHSTGQVEKLPKKQGQTKQRDRFFNYILVQKNGATLMQQRGAKDIWEGLFQFPLVETEKRAGAKTVAKELGDGTMWRSLAPTSEPARHILSHQRIHSRFWRWNGVPPASLLANSKWVKNDDVESLAVPRHIERYLEENDL